MVELQKILFPPKELEKALVRGSHWLTFWTGNQGRGEAGGHPALRARWGLDIKGLSQGRAPSQHSLHVENYRPARGHRGSMA